MPDNSKYYDSTVPETGPEFDALIGALLSIMVELFGFTAISEGIAIDLKIFMGASDTLHLTYEDSTGEPQSVDVPRIGNYVVNNFTGAPEDFSTQSPITAQTATYTDSATQEEKTRITITDLHGHIYIGEDPGDGTIVWTNVTDGADKEEAPHFWKSERAPEIEDPANPGLNYWVDMSDPAYPELKVPHYKTDTGELEWLPLTYENMMSADTYDTDKYKTDIFEYLASKLMPYNWDYSMFIRHIMNLLRLKHLTPELAERLNNALSVHVLEVLIAETETEVLERTRELIEEFLGLDDNREKLKEPAKYWERHLYGDDPTSSIECTGHTYNPTDKVGENYRYGETISVTFTVKNTGQRDYSWITPTCAFNDKTVKLDVTRSITKNNIRDFTFTHVVSYSDQQLGKVDITFNLVAATGDSILTDTDSLSIDGGPAAASLAQYIADSSPTEIAEAEPIADDLVWPEHFDPHITDEQARAWDSKANWDHRHQHVDHRVKIHASDVDATTGAKINRDRLPDMIRERIVEILDLSVLADVDMTSEANKIKYHRGNILHTPPNRDTGKWYKIVDPSLIGTPDYEESCLEFTIYAKHPDPFRWAEVTDKPTTVGGYGIEDLYTKGELDPEFEHLTEVLTAAQENLSNLLAEREYTMVGSPFQLTYDSASKKYHWKNEANLDKMALRYDETEDGNTNIEIAEVLKDTATGIRAQAYRTTEFVERNRLCHAGILWHKEDLTADPIKDDDYLNPIPFKFTADTKKNNWPEENAEADLTQAKWYPSATLITSLPDTFILGAITINADVFAILAKIDGTEVFYIGEEPPLNVVEGIDVLIIQTATHVILGTATIAAAEGTGVTYTFTWTTQESFGVTQMANLYAITGVDNLEGFLTIYIDPLDSNVTVKSYAIEEGAAVEKETITEGAALDGPPEHFCVYQNDIIFYFEDHFYLVSGNTATRFTMSDIHVTNYKGNPVTNYTVLYFAIVSGFAVFYASMHPIKELDDGSLVPDEEVDRRVLCSGKVTLAASGISFTIEDEIDITPVQVLEMITTPDQTCAIAKARVMGQDLNDGPITPILISVDLLDMSLFVSIEHGLSSLDYNYTRKFDNDDSNTEYHAYTAGEDSDDSYFLIFGPPSFDSNSITKSNTLYLAKKKGPLFSASGCDVMPIETKVFPESIPIGIHTFVDQDGIKHHFRWAFTPTEPDAAEDAEPTEYELAIQMTILDALVTAKNEVDYWYDVLDFEELTATYATWNEDFPAYPPVA